MRLRTSFLGTFYLKLIETHLLPRIERTGTSANQLTIWGVALAVLVPVAFYFTPLLGLLLMILSGIADSLDGLVARKSNQVTVYGAFLDSSLDRVSDFTYLVGFWVMFRHLPNRELYTMAIFAALLLTLMISYTKARAEGLGVQCRVGLMERGLRAVYLILWCLIIIIIPSQTLVVLWIGLAIYITLVFMTVIQRLFHVRYQLRHMQTGDDH